MWRQRLLYACLSACGLISALTMIGCWSGAPSVGTSMRYEKDLDALSIVEPAGVVTNLFGQKAALVPLPLLLDAIK